MCHRLALGWSGAYGLYAPTKRVALAGCRAQLGQGPVVPPAVLDWQTACQASGGTTIPNGVRCVVVSLSASV